LLLQHLHHVGITVSDLPRSVDFWSRLTGGTASEVMIINSAHIASLVGYPDVRLSVANVLVPGGLMIELLQYTSEDAEPYDPGTAHPGNVHLCFLVADMDEGWKHAVQCGAVPVGDGPVVIPDGPQAGGQLAYLRSVDAVSIELRSSPAVQQESS
jgi:catechol 2,3-dioxygenase-like lactoylglutathione lyase family enzyme